MERHAQGSRVVALGLAALLALGLGGCASYRLDEPARLNSTLCHLHWPDECFGREGRPAGCDTRVNQVALQPGMKLIVHNAPFQRKGTNLRPPALAAYEWIVPGEGRYGQEDLFFLSYLMAAGIPLGGFDETSRFDGQTYLTNLANGLRDPKFSEDLQRRLLQPAVASLRLEASRSGPPQGERCEAEGVRTWLTRPGRTDFDNAVTSAQQRLLVTLPASGGQAVDLEVFRWSSGFFHEDIGPLTDAETNAWYRGQAGGGGNMESRAHLALEIPVRLPGEWESRYVPVYWSVQDLEDRLGVEVLGIHRREGYLPPLAAGGRRICASQGKMRRECFLGSYRAFTIGFASLQESSGAARYIRLDGSRKKDVLLAPGDAVLLGRRLAATDRPEVR